MKYFDWSREKNEVLKLEREVSFEEVVDAIEEGRLLDVIEHPNREKHPGQKELVVEIDDYAYVVPFVEDETKVFLKTIFPSRKATKKYLLERRGR